MHFTIPTNVDPENSRHIYSVEERIVPSPTLQGRHVGWRGGRGSVCSISGHNVVIRVSLPPPCRSNDRDAARRRGAWVETMRFSNCLPQNDVYCVIICTQMGNKGVGLGGLGEKKKRQKKMDVVRCGWGSAQHQNYEPQNWMVSFSAKKF